MQPKVIAVIVSCNGGKWIKECVQSLLKNNYERLEIVLVDNASKDKTVSIVEENFKEVTVFAQKENLGYGKGGNIGIRYALSHDADYMLLLNQDIKLGDNCIENLAGTCQENSTIGIAVPSQMTYDGSRLDPAFEKSMEFNQSYQNDLKKGDRSLKRSYETEKIIGAAILFRISLFEIVGLFDPLFFMYHEEADLCRRVLYHGFQIHIVPGAKIYHWHALNHPDKMSFKSNLSSLYGYYFYILKDPLKPVTQNFQLILQQMIKWIFRDKEILKTVKRFFINLIVASIVIFYIPRLLKSRKTNIKRKRNYSAK